MFTKLSKQSYNGNNMQTNVYQSYDGPLIQSDNTTYVLEISSDATIKKRTYKHYHRTYIFQII